MESTREKLSRNLKEGTFFKKVPILVANSATLSRLKLLKRIIDLKKTPIKSPKKNTIAAPNTTMKHENMNSHVLIRFPVKLKIRSASESAIK